MTESMLFFCPTGYQQPDVYHLTRSQPSKQTDLEKRILTFSKDDPKLRVEPVSSDPTSPDFTAFNIFSSQTGELLYTFRAEDIVQQRNFMVALGGKGPGLFSQPEIDDIEDVVSDNLPAMHRAVSNASDLSQRQNSYNEMANEPSTRHITPPSYDNILNQLPVEFYFAGYAQPTPRTSSILLPPYDPANPPEVKPTHAPHHQGNLRFRPPHGPPVSSPIVVGYGAEVGLKPHQQALWDPERKYYFFIDHNQKVTFIKDPRPLPRQKPISQTQELVVADSHQDSNQVPEACKDSAVVRATALRAALKPHGFVLKASGRNGRKGANGKEGSGGKNGANGIHGHGYLSQGTSGGDGGCGEHGEDGMEGESGTDGSSVILNLSGDAANLCVSGSCSFVAKLGGEESKEVLFVDCHGGDGGDGGNGGDGGRGGRGGDGVKGAWGGDGGNGGDGGMGGDGGRAGNGGNAGSGGNCVIQAVDPRLLMLVEANCTHGIPGRWGNGGKGGEGGPRGFGGEGGAGDIDSLDHNSTENAAAADVVIVPGLRGKPGMTGIYGEDAADSADGLPGENGGILWVIKSPNGEVLHRSGTRYDAEVVSLEVSTNSESCIYEPNQEISVSNITVVNSGGLPLPAGAKLFIPSTETVRFKPTVFEMPELAPNEKFQVPATFHGRIFDQATPNAPGLFSSTAQFTPTIELLGRPFEKSCLEQTLPIQYPVKLAFALSKKNMGCGEVATIEVGVQNISSSSCSDSRGGVTLQIHMESHLTPLGTIVSESSSSETLTYSVTYDPSAPRSLCIHISKIEPGKMLEIPLAVQLDDEAEIGHTCIWQADLYLQGKLIEYMHSEIKVAPPYSPPQSPLQVAVGDVLMITSSSIPKEELAFWQRIFDILGVNVDYWDASYQKPPGSDDSSTENLSSNLLPPFKDLYAGKMILFPHCNLKELPAEDIITHFHGKNHRGAPLRDLNSSMLLFLPPSYPKSLEDHTMQCRGSSKLLRYLCSNEKRIQLSDNAYSGYHLLSPGTVVSPDWSIKRSEKNMVKRLEKEIPSQVVALMKRSNMIRSTGTIRYNYGTMDLRRCPLLCSCNFQCVDNAGGNILAMGFDDPFLTTTASEAPLGSHFGQVLLATLSGLPLRCKLSLLKATEDDLSPNNVRLHLPNGCTLSRTELAAICTAREIAEELLNCSGSVSRMQFLAEDVQNRKSGYTANSLIVLQLLDLIQRETDESKKLLSTPEVVQAASEIQRLCVQISGLFDSRNTISPLPSLKVLQDTSRVLRCHQHSSKENSFDLTDYH